MRSLCAKFPLSCFKTGEEFEVTEWWLAQKSNSKNSNFSTHLVRSLFEDNHKFNLTHMIELSIKSFWWLKRSPKINIRIWIDPISILKITIDIVVYAQFCFISHYDIFHSCRLKVFSNRLPLFISLSKSHFTAANFCSHFIFPPMHFTLLKFARRFLQLFLHYKPVFSISINSSVLIL